MGDVEPVCLDGGIGVDLHVESQQALGGCEHHCARERVRGDSRIERACDRVRSLRQMAIQDLVQQCVALRGLEFGRPRVRVPAR